MFQYGTLGVFEPLSVSRILVYIRRFLPLFSSRCGKYPTADRILSYHDRLDASAKHPPTSHQRDSQLRTDRDRLRQALEGAGREPPAAQLLHGAVLRRS